MSNISNDVVSSLNPAESVPFFIVKPVFIWSSALVLLLEARLACPAATVNYLSEGYLGSNCKHCYTFKSMLKRLCTVVHSVSGT